MNNASLGILIGKIYDCAVDPDLWEATLSAIRDELQLAFVSMNYMHFPPSYPETPPEMTTFITPWDQEWIAALQPLVSIIPEFDAMRNGALDEPVSQLGLVDEAEFRKSEFCRKWVEPQGLRDTCNINVIKRDRQVAIMSAVTYDSREMFSQADFELIGNLTPHLRRAMLISDIVDETRSWVQLYKSLLDKMSVVIFLVSQDGKLEYHNAAGEAMLSNGSCIGAIQGRLFAQSPAQKDAFVSSINRACSEDVDTLGSWGNGMALPGKDGQIAIAYVLPLGRSERRRALGPGLAALFVTTEPGAIPPSLEVLSALSGLTSTEARIALAIADGQPTNRVATEAGISMHTLRKHLANVYEKTGMRSQSSLAAFVNRFAMPVRHPH
ncbi:MAG: hypothetical protein KDJ67_05900 [Nitratireductor sp.]|nr:hypothetical protein [Nitratireductor sp.]